MAKKTKNHTSTVDQLVAELVAPAETVVADPIIETPAPAEPVAAPEPAEETPPIKYMTTTALNLLSNHSAQVKLSYYNYFKKNVRPKQKPVWTAEPEGIVTLLPSNEGYDCVLNSSTTTGTTTVTATLTTKSGLVQHIFQVEVLPQQVDDAHTVAAEVTYS